MQILPGQAAARCCISSRWCVECRIPLVGHKIERLLLDDVRSRLEQEREAIHFLPESAHAYLRCPGCGGPDFVLAAGRGVSIEAVELEGD